MKEKMKVFKLRDKKTGLFSSGGMKPTFNEIGKIWNQESHVKLHLSCMVWNTNPPIWSRGTKPKPTPYEGMDLEIIPFELTIIEKELKK